MPGPIEPITKRGHAGVENSAATFLAIRMLKRFNSSNAVGHLKFAKADAVTVEGVGFDAVAARVEEAAMDFLDPLGVGVNERIGQVEEGLPIGTVSPVPLVWLVAVQAGPHRAIEYDDAFAHEPEEWVIEGGRRHESFVSVRGKTQFSL